MCVTVCNIGRDQNQQFICNERKSAQPQCFKHYNKQANRFCNQINTYSAEYQSQHHQWSRHRQWSVPMQCFVIEWNISASDFSPVPHSPVTGLVLSHQRDIFSHDSYDESDTYFGTWDGRDKKVGVPWQHPTPLSRPWLVRQLWLWPLIGQQGLVLTRPWPPAWALFTLRWFVTDPGIDWRNFNSIIDTKTLDLLLDWPLHELSFAAETKRWHIPGNMRIHTICDINMGQ